jgi:hypothetical protein
MIHVKNTCEEFSSFYTTLRNFGNVNENLSKRGMRPCIIIFIWGVISILISYSSVFGKLIGLLMLGIIYLLV